jgi:hypothetical protein
MEVVKLYYPNQWKKNISKFIPENKTEFNWFLCSRRILDPSGYYVIEVSPHVYFYSENSGKTFQVPLSNEKRAKLLLLNEPLNKRYLIEKGFPLKCESENDVLSHECDLVTDKTHLLQAANFVKTNLGIDGVAIKHECHESPQNIILCSDATFVIDKERLEKISSSQTTRCGIIPYAMKYNSQIRDTIKNFPTCDKINEMLENVSCQMVNKVLHEYLKNK